MKKTAIVTTIILLVCTALVASGCKSASDSTVTAAKAAPKSEYKLSFEYGDKTYIADKPIITFSPAKETVSIVAGDNSEWVLMIDFKGKGTGTFKGSANLLFPPLGDYRSEDFNITITSYGDNREGIEGSFFGTLTASMGSSKTVEIASGKFSAWRSPDLD